MDAREDIGDIVDGVDAVLLTTGHERVEGREIVTRVLVADEEKKFFLPSATRRSPASAMLLSGAIVANPKKRPSSRLLEGRKPKADPLAKWKPVFPGPRHLSRTVRFGDNLRTYLPTWASSKDGPIHIRPTAGAREDVRAGVRPTWASSKDGPIHIRPTAGAREDVQAGVRLVRQPSCRCDRCWWADLVDLAEDD